MWNASETSLSAHDVTAGVNLGGAMSGLGTSSSAAKDVDIYMGNACVWSGILESESASASDPHLSLKEGYPSDRKADSGSASLSSQPTQTYHYVGSSSSSGSSSKGVGAVPGVDIIQGDGNATGGGSTGGFVVSRAPSAVVRLSSSSSSSSSYPPPPPLPPLPSQQLAISMTVA